MRTVGPHGIGCQTRNLGVSAVRARDYAAAVKIDTRRVLAEGKIEQLARDSSDAAAFWRDATAVLRDVLPFDFHPCWFTIDPATLLVTGHVNEGLERTPPEIAHAWYAEADVNAPADLVRVRGGATTVTAATGGDPEASWRWRNLLDPSGFDDSLDAVLRTGSTVWGAVNLLHTSDRRPFTADDVRYVARLSSALATGTRLGLLRAPSGRTSDATGPAVAVVTEDLAIVSMTANANGWLPDLPDVGPYRPGRLPMPVQVVVLRASRSPDGHASVTVRSDNRGWVRIHGSRLAGTGPNQVAVVIETSRPTEVAHLRLAAHGLTAREVDVVELVLRGRSTKQIAAELVMSEYTVQDRLKSVFEKVGVRSRRELVAAVHAADYQPLIDRNDERNRSGLPLHQRFPAHR